MNVDQRIKTTKFFQAGKTQNCITTKETVGRLHQIEQLIGLLMLIRDNGERDRHAGNLLHPSLRRNPLQGQLGFNDEKIVRDDEKFILKIKKRQENRKKKARPVVSYQTRDKSVDQKCDDSGQRISVVYRFTMKPMNFDRCWEGTGVTSARARSLNIFFFFKLPACQK